MENMARALQPDIMGYIGFIIFALVIYLIGWWLSKQKIDHGFELDGKDIRRWGRNIATCIIALTLLAGGYRVLTYSAVNRMPRSDVDGSAVYDKMNQNAQPNR